LPSFAIQLLHPLVRPAGRHTTRPATEQEKAEYAGSLIRLGAWDEAYELLKTLDAGKLPEVWLMEAWVYFHQWKYAESIPLLEKYVVAKGITDYQRFLGNVNLAAALTYEKDSRSTALVKGLIEVATREKYQLLKVNLLMIQIEDAVNRRDWPAADRASAMARESISEEMLESFLARKWEAIAALYASPKSPAALAGIQKIRQEAVARGHWETLRNCDFHLAIATKDEALFRLVYFGTPFSSLRDKLVQDFGGQPEIPERFHWTPSGEPSLPTLDLLSHKEICARVKGHKQGSLNHRLLAALLRDLYRPTRTASLHRALYEGEYFNPASSPGRVHQAIRTLKRWLKRKGLPLRIEATKGGYILALKKPCAIIVPRESTPNKHQWLTERLRTGLQNPASFTAKEAARSLEMGIWKTIRLLSGSVKLGLLLRTGKANQTRYTVVADESSSSRAA